MGIAANLVSGTFDIKTQAHFVKIGMLVANAGKGKDGGWNMERFFNVLHTNGRHIEGYLEDGANLLKENSFIAQHARKTRATKK